MAVDRRHAFHGRFLGRPDSPKTLVAVAQTMTTDDLVFLFWAIVLLLLFLIPLTDTLGSSSDGDDD